MSSSTKPRTDDARFFLMTPRLLAASVVIGVLMGLDDLLYAYGLAYLPVSTSSILISTQLAFTAGFALLLVRQRFTPFSVNALVLLSVGAAMLGMNSSGDRPAGVSGAQYAAGFAMTLGAAALFGLMLPAVELSQARHAAHAGPGSVNYALVMEMQLVIGLAATGFSAVGMLVNNDFHVSLKLPPVHLSVATTPRPRLHMDPVHCRIFSLRLFL
jgi:drug/metabolite transporter (DMT)-like permease